MEHPEERFYLKMAEKLGMSKTDFLAKHTSAEITEWIAEEKIRAFEHKQALDKQKQQRSVKGRRGRR